MATSQRMGGPLEKCLDPGSLNFAFGQKLLPYLGIQGCKTEFILKRGTSAHIYFLPRHVRTTFYKKGLVSFAIISGEESYMKLCWFYYRIVFFFLNLRLWEITRSIQTYAWCRISVPRPGTESELKRWKCQILTTRPPGNSLEHSYLKTLYSWMPLAKK